MRSLLAFLASSPVLLTAQSLEEALSSMLERYPKIRIYQSRVLISENRLAIERSARKPQLSLTMRAGEERFANDRGHQVFGETATASLQAKQLIYDGGYTRSKISEARSTLGSSNELLERTRQDLALELAIAYVDAIKYARLTDLATENIELHRDALDKITIKFEAGAGPRADVLLVTGRLAKAQATLESRKRQLQRSHNSFLKLTGHFPGELQQPTFPAQAIPRGYDDVDFVKTPSVRAANFDLEAAISSKRTSASASKPQLNFIVEGDVSESDRYASAQEDALAVISLSYNIFDGGRKRADFSRAESRIQEADWKLKDSIVEVETNFANAWNELVSIEDRIGLLDMHRQAIESVAEAYHEQFELGKRPLINLLDIENELFGARSTVEEERFNRLQAAYRLLSSTGNLIQAIQ